MGITRIAHAVVCSLVCVTSVLYAPVSVGFGFSAPLPVPGVTIGPYPPEYLAGYPGAYGYSGNFGYWGPNGGWWGPGYYGPSFTVGVGWTGSGRSRTTRRSSGRVQTIGTKGMRR